MIVLSLTRPVDENFPAQVDEQVITVIVYDSLPLRFRKAGRAYCGGAQEIHCATCHNGVTPSKTKEILKLTFIALNFLKDYF